MAEHRNANCYFFIKKKIQITRCHCSNTKAIQDEGTVTFLADFF
jgi:hypothetical protein